MPTPFIIDPNLDRQLRKLNFSVEATNAVNKKYADKAANIPPPVFDAALSAERADLVARWTIDFALGVEDLPLNKFGPITKFPGHQAIDADYPPAPTNSASASGILSHAPETDIVKTLAARVFASVQARTDGPDSENPTRFQTLPSYFKDCFDFSYATHELLKPINQAEAGFAPDWDLNPNNFRFQPGFPRTAAEKQLSFQIMYLLAVFTQHANTITSAMTDQIRQDAPLWHLPSAANINWADPAARTTYFKAADKSLSDTDNAVRGILRTYLLDALTTIEVPQFLLSSRTFVRTDPSVLEQYWSRQLQSLIYESYRNIDRFMANQRFLLNTLKSGTTKESGQVKAEIVASTVMHREDELCRDLLAKEKWWSVAGPSLGDLISFMVYIGEWAGPYLEDQGEKGRLGYGEVGFQTVR